MARKTSSSEADESQVAESSTLEERLANAPAYNGVVDPAVYQQMLDDLASSSSDSQIVFLKGGRTRLRIVADDPVNFFIPVNRTFNDQVRTRYLFKAFLLEEQEIKGLVVAKMVLQAILGILAEGYDLMGENGHGLTIIRSGEGLATTYNAMPSQKPVIVPQQLIDESLSLQELAAKAQELDERIVRKRAMGEGSGDALSLGQARGGESRTGSDIDW